MRIRNPQPTLSIQRTNRQRTTQEYTYNEDGLTYNELGVMYGGLYEADIMPAISSSRVVAMPVQATRVLPSPTSFVVAPSIQYSRDVYASGSSLSGQPIGLLLALTYAN